MGLVLIDLLGFVVLLVTVILLAAKKLRMEKPLLLIVYLTLLPIIVVWINSDFTNTLVEDILVKDRSFSHLIFLVLFSLEFFIASLIIVIRYNAFPYSPLSKIDGVNPNSINLDKARRLLNFSILSNIVNIVVMTPIILGFTFINLLLVGFPGAIIFLIPLDAFAIFVFTADLVFMFSVTYVFVINGTIRFLLITKYGGKGIAVYCILMLVPFANIITSIILSKRAKAILREQGYYIRKSSSVKRELSHM